MAVNTVGDLAMSYIFRSRNAQLKADMVRFSTELSTGQVASVSEAVNANFGPVSAMEHSLSQLEAYRQSISESAGLAGAMQSSLETIRQSALALSTDLLTSGSTSSAVHLDALGASAAQAFHAAVSQLNTSYGGRALFSGAATDRAALADSHAILSALEVAVATETTASGVKAAVDAWFDPGGGFDTIAYTGSPTPLAPMQAGANRAVDLDVTAADTAIRDTLKGLALSALMSSPPLSEAPSEQAVMAKTAGDLLLQANTDLLQTQARIGVAEETLEDAKTSNSSEIAALELGLAELLSVDVYESATKLEQAESSLELLYALTARSARLNLADYL
ncbi:flagellin [Tropicimonas sediminicola]|uniref:Flagellar hook-associated protein 3 FlgL n=1 Tax=Tropicimonas sediminicola TaxID=1031541 RepID=A0A239JH45_9RHOB|nr:flagellin [Tropicimonas sediminicola]SNT04054.1 flagellar hook-associated protein 3 FlgL [Tropicimonas sediminicola]